ncbi:MAG: hypothetical protein JNN08_22195 [Bryobacterales bacterium]|nr:hypothetical protein [Bryobacterales bacterium]
MPDLSAARPLRSEAVSATFSALTLCEPPILLAAGRALPAAVAPDIVGRIPREAAQHRHCPSFAWLPGPKVPVTVPAHSLVPNSVCCLPVDPLAPRRKQWSPAQPDALLPYPAPKVQQLPRQPSGLTATALWFAPPVFGYPPMPRLRDASAPVSRPAGKLLPLPGCTFAPITVVAAPIAHLVPAVLPTESRRTIRGLKLRAGENLGAWEDLPAWQRLSQRATARWRRFPALPKWGAVAGALLLAGFASIPEVSPAKESGGWWEVPPVIAQRAAIELSDDFRGGLAHWQGGGDWSRSWTFDRAGFLQTGPLALFRPSRTLTNYEFEFLGQIQRKGMGWVVRARDLNNYQALKLAIVGGGGVPEVVLFRYPVVGGRQGKITERRVPLDLRQDTVYNIITRVSGSDFTVTVQGQVADYWSEPALAAGGVGLFSSKGEQARVRWVEVRHQNDTLGKLCALFAPPGQTGANQ